MNIIKGIVNKVASRKLAVTAVDGAAAVTGTIELTWPMAAVGGGLYRRAGGGGYLGRAEARQGINKRGNSHLRRSPQFCC